MAATNFWTPTVSQGRSDFIGAVVGPSEEWTIRMWLPTSEYGAVGHVWLSERVEDGQRCVVKTPKDPRSEGWKKELRGAQFALGVPHENLMSVLHIGEQQCPIKGPGGRLLGTPGATFSYIIIECCTQLDMFSYCEKQPFSQELAKHYFVQLVKGIHCLHTSHGAHRDLKPDNLLLSRLLTLKIGDFGFARDLEGATEFTMQCGTAIYNAPEMQKGGGYSSDVDPLAQDVWMMGCCLFILLTNTFPFEGEASREAFFQELDDPADPNPPQHQRYWRGHLVLRGGKRPFDLMRKFLADGRRAPGTGVLDLINRMWDRNFKRRITTAEILQHPWITTNEDGSPYVPYDMAGAVLAVATGGNPVPNSLLGEMCSKIAGSRVVDMLRRDNAPYIRR